MIYRFLRPLIFRFDPESAHEKAIAAAAFLSRHPSLSRCVRNVIARPHAAPIQRLGLEFPHAIGLAGGFDKNGVAPLAWWALGFGFAELGTVTPKPQPGHPRPRMFRFPEERALVNRMGFNNDGAEAVAARLADQRRRGLRPPMPLAISLGKNATTPLEAAADDYAAAARFLAPHADFLTINISSPNTRDLRSLQDETELKRIIAAVTGEALGKPILVKLAPELEAQSLESVLDGALSAGAAGIIATNTLSTANRSDLPQGGLSGRPLRDIAPRRVAAIRDRVGPNVTVIGCGGIDDADSARRMFDAGADLIQIYSGLVFEGPFLAARLSRGSGRRKAESGKRSEEASSQDDPDREESGG